VRGRGGAERHMSRPCRAEYLKVRGDYLMLTVEINGRSVQVMEGATILEAAKQLWIDIPAFCLQNC
jgi:hypothetical protein